MRTFGPLSEKAIRPHNHKRPYGTGIVFPASAYFVSLWSISSYASRTLQEYRNNRVLPFILLGGKVLYPETGLRGVLEANYRKPLE